MDEKVKRTGFDCPLSFYQILVWLLLAWNTFVSFVVVLPFLTFFNKLLYFPLTGLLWILLVVCGLKLTNSDPTDYYTEVSDPESRHCTYCQRIVNSASKHCRKCNRCVIGFDHHCKLVNNCIGAPNYRLFVVLILIVWTFYLALSAQTVYLIAIFHQDFSFLDHGFFSGKFSYIAIIMTAVQSICLLAMVSYLIMLHVFLCFKGLTTFEYITRKYAVAPTPSKNLDPQESVSCQENVVINETIQIMEIPHENNSKEDNTVD